MRRTATIRRGTRMIKLLSDRQLGGLPARPAAARLLLPLVRPGRRCGPPDELAHADRRPRADPGRAGRVRRCAGGRSTRPTTTSRSPSPVGDRPPYPGLTAISPHDRVGPPVLGTGFAPSQHHLVPEFVTADLADLPMPAGTIAGRVRPGRHRGQPLPVTCPSSGPGPGCSVRSGATCWPASPDIPLDQEYVQIAGRPGRRVHIGRPVPRAELPGARRPAARVPGAGQGPGGPVPGRRAGPPDPLRDLARRGRARWSAPRAAGCRLRLCRPDAGQRVGAGRRVRGARRLRGVGRRAARSTDIRDVDLHVRPLGSAVGVAPAGPAPRPRWTDRACGRPASAGPAPGRPRSAPTPTGPRRCSPR